MNCLVCGEPRGFSNGNHLRCEKVLVPLNEEEFRYWDVVLDYKRPPGRTVPGVVRYRDAQPDS